MSPKSKKIRTLFYQKGKIPQLMSIPNIPHIIEGMSHNMNGTEILCVNKESIGGSLPVSKNSSKSNNKNSSQPQPLSGSHKVKNQNHSRQKKNSSHDM